MQIHECEQGTPGWWDVRRGVPSASNFDRILTPGGKLSAQSEGYIDELIADRIRGMPDDVEAMTTRPMQEGIECEPFARQWYREECTELGMEEVREVGFVTTDDGRLGGSPDGLVYRDMGSAWVPVGGTELKCPMLKTHIGYLRIGGLPPKYRLQVHGYLSVSGLDWWDFVSWAPGDVPALRVRVEPDEFTETLGEALREFADRYEAEWKRVEAMLPVRELAAAVDDDHGF